MEKKIKGVRFALAEKLSGKALDVAKSLNITEGLVILKSFAGSVDYEVEKVTKAPIDEIKQITQNLHGRTQTDIDKSFRESE